MALEIKAIPTLKGKEAERFVKEADKAYQKKEKTDFSKQVKIARAILKKANTISLFTMQQVTRDYHMLFNCSEQTESKKDNDSL